MGTLQVTPMLPQDSLSVINETVQLTAAGTTVTKATLSGFGGAAAVTMWTSGAVAIPASNYTFNSVTGFVSNATVVAYSNAKLSYNYNVDSQSQLNTQYVLKNTSTGVSSFFGSITPVYAILAVLVIILVLVVLVRVVSGGGESGGMGSGKSAEVI
jgi:hypothetical protein